MRILGINRDHDGGLCLLDDGKLVFALEAEKDSHDRHAKWEGPELAAALTRLGVGLPDAVSEGGWFKRDGGYVGIEPGVVAERPIDFLGDTKLPCFSSSHERSHLLCAYGLSPFEQGQPCYALVWEGVIGSFYEIDEQVRVRKLFEVMDQPGHKYSFLYELAEPRYGADARGYSFASAGKLMALAAYSDRGPMNDEERRTVELILDGLGRTVSSKADFAGSSFLDSGLDSPAFRNLAGKLSDALFDRFDAAARQLRKGWPLLIAGGCGLNCEWNSRFRDSGLFAEVFVPPCANDSGSALGTAIDAQLHLTGRAKVEWSVYAGEKFVLDEEAGPGFRQQPLQMGAVAEALAKGAVLAWVQGRYEMGPRALGNRSIIAAPFETAMTRRLNEIKYREDYRPIAPVCLEERVGTWFESPRPSPYMLHFSKVIDPRLAAITHVDGTARVQTVSQKQNPPLHALLEAFERRTGAGVLCNTSLNFSGLGFINRMSDLHRYVEQRGLDGMVVGDRFYLREQLEGGLR